LNPGGALPSVEDRFRLASAASNDCLWDWDVATGVITRSAAMARRFGYSSDLVAQTSNWWRSRIHPDDAARAERSIDEAVAHASTGSWSCEYRFRRSDGSYAEVCDRAYIVRDARGQALRVVGAVMDLSEIAGAYRALEESEERYRYTIELTGQIAWTADAAGEKIHFDERWSALTGLSQSVSREEWQAVAHPDDLARALRHWTHSLANGCPLAFEHRLKTGDGGYRWFRSRAAAHRNSTGAIDRWYGTIEDINERVSSRLALKTLANFDDLTSLPNRHLFSKNLESSFEKASRCGASLALIVLDVDDFKSVNDLFGHDAGDLLLRSFAERMLGEGVKLYRIGGDEFAAILEGPTSRKLALAFASRIHDALAEPFRLGDTVLDCRASIGCALFPVHGNSSTELLKSADIALYAAKAAGNGQTRMFASAMRNTLQRRSSMMEIARRSLSCDDVTAFFQPKVSLRTGQVVGFEALMRVQSERFGAQQPAVIAAAFDHPELAVELAGRVLSKVIAVIRRWRDEGLCFGRVAINASPLEFRGGGYAERLLSRLRDENIAPEMIEVEVTETVFLNRPEDAILQSLHSLKEAGVTIALDDFGTGYASLSHLRQYPVDALKIDRSFTKEVAEDPRQRLITGAVIDLSRTIGIQTVAEGIETDEQADLLEALGCDIGQGYLFGRALCDAEAETLLRNSAARLRGDIVRALRTA
jgi:diguanylate cyclase (GGDEF)-like protein/PAS domain S-box-containing protein